MKAKSNNNVSQFLKSEDLVKVTLLKHKIINQQFQKVRFSNREKYLIERFCYALGYKLSVNKKMKTMRIYNPLNKRYGYLQKCGENIYYGYIQKIANNSQFIPKEVISSNLNIYKNFVELKVPKTKDLFKFSCHIIDLGYAS